MCIGHLREYCEGLGEVSAVFVVVILPDCIVARSIFSWFGGDRRIGREGSGHILHGSVGKKGASIGVKGGTKGEKAKFIGGNLGEPNYSVI